MIVYHLHLSSLFIANKARQFQNTVYNTTHTFTLFSSHSNGDSAISNEFMNKIITRDENLPFFK